MLAKEQLNALRYYVGKKDAYPGAPKTSEAYCTLNTLFYSDTVSERARAKEGKRLERAFITNDRFLLSLCCDLIKAAITGGEGEPEETVYRVARKSDVDAMLKEGMTMTFTSTSKNDFLSNYTKKCGLILLEFHIPPNVPRADIVKLIPDAADVNEAEVLLPPWLPIKLTKCELSERELSIKDSNGKSPLSKYVVTIGNTMVPPEFFAEAFSEAKAIEAGRRVIDDLMKGEDPDPIDESAYIVWKKMLILKVENECIPPERIVKALERSLNSVSYITGRNPDTNKDYLLDELFEVTTARRWIKAILGVADGSGLSERIDSLDKKRITHTITTFLLGILLRDKLGLGFNSLPRIFSNNNKAGDPFPFFWSVACLGHDIGYLYENDETLKLDDYLDHHSLKGLMHLCDDKSLLDLDKNDLSFYGLTNDERDWAIYSIGLAKGYYEYRLLPGEYRCIDHGISGALIMFDELRSMAKGRSGTDPKLRHEDGDISEGFTAANIRRSRFPACAILVSLAIARHNMWVVDKNADDIDSLNKVKWFEKHGLDGLITDNAVNKLSIDNPLDQLLYFLDFVDTIDPFKAFCLKNKLNFDTGKVFFENGISVKLSKGMIGGSHRISIQFNNEIYKSLKVDDVDKVDQVKASYVKNTVSLADWLLVDKAPNYGNNELNVFLLVTERRCNCQNDYGITNEELLDLCFYQGIPDGSRPGRFFRRANAYQTFNLLMMDGLEGERIRIGCEHQLPDSIYIRNWEQTVKVFCNVFTAQCRYWAKHKTVLEPLHRMDRRINAGQMIRKGTTIAFTSTTKAEILEEFLKDKKNPLIEKLTFTEPVPAFDYQEVLKDDYVFTDEEEVLLPPFIKIKAPTEEEAVDNAFREGKKVGELYVELGGMKLESSTQDYRSELRKKIDALSESAAETLNTFVNDNALAANAREDDWKEYCTWKKAFQELIYAEYCGIFTGMNTF